MERNQMGAFNLGDSGREIQEWQTARRNADSPLIRLLAHRQQAADADPTWVFPSTTSKSGHVEGLESTWRRVLERAAIRDCRIHDLGRTLGSVQAIQGSSLIIIGESLGHQSLQSTAIYARLTNSPVYDSVERAGNFMLEGAPVGLLPEE